MCEFAYSLEFICNLKNLYPWHLCSPFRTCTDRQKNWVIQHARSQLSLNKGTPCLLSARTMKKRPFCGPFSAVSFAFVCLWLVIEWPPSAVLKCCLVFLSARRLRHAFWRKTRVVRCFIQAWMTELLAMSSVLTNNNMVHSEKGRRICRSVPGAALQRSNICSVWGSDGKVANFVDLWDDHPLRNILL